MLTSEKDLQANSFVNVRDRDERGLMEETQLFLAECGWTHQGEDFFSAIARFLAVKLGMDFVCIDVLTGDKLAAQTLSIHFDGNFKDNIIYELKDTPCADVVKNNVCCYVKNVRHFFPNDSILQEMKAESYAGTILRDSTGNPIGLIAVIGRKHLSNANLVKSVIELVGIRAGAELERKKAEDKLRESEEKYRRIVQTASEGIAITDAEARIIFVNDRWSQLLGYTREEAHTMSYFEQFFPEDIPLIKERWELQKSGQHERYEFRLRHKEGRPVWSMRGVSPRIGPKGEFQGVLSMTTDISELKQVEALLRGLNLNLESKVAERTAELQNRARQLKELALQLTETENRERKRLADILHDDLQQNLAAAISHLGFISSRWKHDSFSQEMTDQISRLLKEAIGISRNLSHELNPPGLAYNNLQETFDWLAGQMQQKHGLTVHVDILGEIAAKSETIKTFLFKAAQEMLFNAIKHAKVQECRIKLRRRGENIYLLVSDRGCGCTIEEAPKRGGAGLLKIRERANLLGGSMRMHSSAGKGSTFRIVVPDKP